MKNVFTSILLAFLLGAGTVAQAGPGDGSRITARATELTRRMAERTRMSEGQYVKVKQLNIRLLTEMATLRKQFATDPASLDQALADVQMRYEWDLASILWPKQLAAYEDVKMNFTAANVR